MSSISYSKRRGIGIRSETCICPKSIFLAMCGAIADQENPGKLKLEIWMAGRYWSYQLLLFLTTHYEHRNVRGQPGIRMQQYDMRG